MSTPMNMAFFGSSLGSAYGNSAAAYYRGIIRALAARGHSITFYEPAAPGRPQQRDLPDPSWAEVVVYPVVSEEQVWRVVQEASRADLVIKASDVGVFDTFLAGAVLELQTPNRLVAFWDVDAPATLDRVEHDEHDPFRHLIPNYDVILTSGGGPAVSKTYEAWGVCSCVPIYPALDPATHFPVRPDPRLAAELAFLGDRLPERERHVEEFFFAAAGQMPEQTFLLGGAGWEAAPKPPNVRPIGPVSTGDRNAFNCSSRAVLNVNRASTARYGFAPPTRIFEAAGAGACVLTDAWEGLEMFLEPDREILVAHTGAEVAAHLGDLTPERARLIGGAALQRLRDEHTYAHRAEKFERVLEGKTFIEAGA